MAEFKFNCPKCNGEFVVDDSLAGRLAECSQCKTKIRIPNSPIKEVPVVLKSPRTSDHFGNKKKRLLLIIIAFFCLLILVITILPQGSKKEPKLNNEDCRKWEADTYAQSYIQNQSQLLIRSFEIKDTEDLGNCTYKFSGVIQDEYAHWYNFVVTVKRVNNDWKGQDLYITKL